MGRIPEQSEVLVIYGQLQIIDLFILLKESHDIPMELLQHDRPLTRGKKREKIRKENKNMQKAKRNVAMPAGIRNKLMAAVSMLLVSGIMMVSSTYAWFTLSTAPEVTNIKTTVAGNGSLEIALMPTDGTLAGITSGRGATLNTNWGNLIDLNVKGEGDGAGNLYGLDNVTMYPAYLNSAEFDATKILSIAAYGQDGRVTKLVDDTMAVKSWATDSWSGASYGVRAIGEKDGETDLNTYGYVVDLALRLNSTNTDGTAGKLLLQTAEAQRIYDGSENAQTLGGGSYMSFNTNNNVLNIDDLMKAVRVTFVKDLGLDSGGTVQVLGTAKLDVADKEPADADGNVKAPLYLYNEETKLEDDQAVILDSMTKNAAQQISAVVWLDGNAMKNSSVTVDDAALVTSTLNLQFTTDVDLVPAMNTNLHGEAVDDEPAVSPSASPSAEP